MVQALISRVMNEIHTLAPISATARVASSVVLKQTKPNPLLLPFSPASFITRALVMVPDEGPHVTRLYILVEALSWIVLSLSKSHTQLLHLTQVSL